MDEAVGILRSYEYIEQEDGTAVFSTEQESYGCVFENDIKEIANDIITVAPEVEIHISAVITITETNPEGYDLCVDIDYVDEKMKVDTYEEYYDDFNDFDDFDDDEEEDE